MKQVLIDQNNAVIQIFDYDPFEWITDPAVLEQVKEAPDEVQCWWVYDPETNTFSPPPEPQPEPEPEPTADELLQAFMEGYNGQ